MKNLAEKKPAGKKSQKTPRGKDQPEKDVAGTSPRGKDGHGRDRRGEDLAPS